MGSLSRLDQGRASTRGHHSRYKIDDILRRPRAQCVPSGQGPFQYIIAFANDAVICRVRRMCVAECPSLTLSGPARCVIITHRSALIRVTQWNRRRCIISAQLMYSWRNSNDNRRCLMFGRHLCHACVQIWWDWIKLNGYGQEKCWQIRRKKTLERYHHKFDSRLQKNLYIYTSNCKKH